MEPDAVLHECVKAFQERVLKRILNAAPTRAENGEIIRVRNIYGRTRQWPRWAMQTHVFSPVLTRAIKLSYVKILFMNVLHV